MSEVKESVKTDKEVSLKASELKEIIAAAVTAAVKEAKTPYVSEQDIRNMEQEQAARKQQAEMVIGMDRNKRRAQEMCAHTRRDGSTRMVLVTLEGVPGGCYMHCQECQAQILNATEPEGGAQANWHYDPAKFNHHFQLAQPAIFA